MTDHITLLRARSGARLTKLWRADGSIEGYEDAKTFDATQWPVGNLHELHQVLLLRTDPSVCAIRGSYPALAEAAPGTVSSRVLRRVEETVDTPHHWVMLDVDDYEPLLAAPEDELVEACREFIADKLPPEFQDATFIAQASASAGHPSAKGKLKAHLWFWLEQPVDSIALRTWAKAWGGVDAAVFRQVQPHYIADPVLEEGLVDGQFLRLVFAGALNEAVPITFLGAVPPVTAGAGAVDGEDVDLSLVRGVVADYDIDRVRSELLEALDPNMDHDTWVQVGMALHHQFDGSDEALGLWDEWSSEGASWTEDVCAERWKSFQGERNAGHGGVTLRFILKLVKDKAAKEAAVEDRRRVAREVSEKKAARAAVEPELQGWRDKIAAADSAAVVELDLAPGIRAGQWLDTDRAALIEAIWARLKALKTPVDRRTIKKWITPPPAIGAGGGGGGAAGWVKDWVYVARDKVMFNRETRDMLDREAFNQAMTHKVPLGPGQTMPTAAYTYVMQFEKTIAAAAVYAPPYDALFEFEGTLFANRYKPGCAPVEPESFGEEELEYVAVVQEWLTHLVPSDRERALLISWLAHNVRRPGVKIGWAPYVHSNVQGAGKTTLATFLGAVMGPGAVAVHRGSVLFSKFSGWETESAVALLDEFPEWGGGRSGAEAIDPVENLKNIITGTKVSFERKGKDLAMAPAFCNVLLVSNSLAGLKIAETDRRLFYVSSPMTKDQHAALEAGGFYGRLHHALAHGGGALRRWLLEQPVHEEFGVNRRAPETEARAQAVELSKSDLRSEIEELLETGGAGYGGGVVAVGHLRAAVAALPGRRNEMVKTRAIDFVLQEIGYARIGKVKLGSGTFNAWARPGVVTGTAAEQRRAVATLLRLSIDKAVDDPFLD